MLLKKIVVGFILLIVSLPSTAASRPENAAEMSALPPYCQARFKNKGTKYQAANQFWDPRLGKGTFVHVHHYCSGLNLYNRSSKITNKKERTRTLQSALSNMQYTQTRAPNSRLQSQMIYNIGRTYVKLGNEAQAVKEFNKGIQKHPKAWQNYVGLSDLYKKQGNKKEAVAVLEKGLEIMPDSRSLNRRLAKLKK